MNTWFEVKCSYEKIFENGMQKKTTEKYLVDAMSFTEAEQRAIAELTPYMSGEFELSAVGKKKYSEIFFNENGYKFYQVKVFFITLDEKSGNEKKTGSTILVQSNTFKEAIDVFEEGMKVTLSDYTIASIAETNIVDVFVYEKEEENE